MNFNIGNKSRPKQRNRVGLDIGSSSVKMIEIVSSGENSSLASIGMMNASGSVREPLIGAIKTLSDEMKVTAKEAAISVSGSSVIVRFVTMPKMRDDELKNAIKFEAEKHMPVSINDYIVDHQILKKNDKEGRLDVLLVAAKKDFVMSRISIVEESGFSVSAVDVDTFAVANAFLKSHPNDTADRTEAFLNIGSNFTNVGIICGGSLSFARDISIGGNDFNQAISKALSVDLKRAEEIKLSPNEKLGEVAACTRSITSGLLDEVHLSLDYYENQSGKSVDGVYISGGSSVVPSIEALFKETFESKLIFWDPLSFLDKSRGGFDAALTEKAKSSFAVAVGLALR